MSDGVTSTQEQGTLEPKGHLDMSDKPPTSTLITADLRTTLRLAAKTRGESCRLPNIPERPSRGVKRVSKSSFLIPLSPGISSQIHVSQVLDYSENSSGLKQIKESSRSSKFARPTKRMRKNPAGSETSEATTTPNHEGVSVPQMSQGIPISSSHDSVFADETHIEVPVPMPAFDLPDSILEGDLTSASTSVLILTPRTSPHDTFCISSDQGATENEGEATQGQARLGFDTTQGSSRITSVFEPRNFHFEETLYALSSSEIDRGRSEEGETEDA